MLRTGVGLGNFMAEERFLRIEKVSTWSIGMSVRIGLPNEKRRYQNNLTSISLSAPLDRFVDSRLSPMNKVLLETKCKAGHTTGSRDIQPTV